MGKIEKIVTRLFAVEENRNKAVAEVIEGCGCGFDYLIRITKQYAYDTKVFEKCASICGVNSLRDVTTEESIDKSIIEKSYKDGFLYKHENIAIVVDDIIQ